MREPQLVMLMQAGTAREVQDRSRRFLQAIHRCTETSKVRRTVGSTVEQREPASSANAIEQIERWLEDPVPVASELVVTLSQALHCTEDTALSRFGCMSAIVWQPASQWLRLTLMIGSQSLFVVTAEGFEAVRRRSTWLRSLADQLWEAVGPELLVADFQVLDLIEPDPLQPLGLPWLMYAKSPVVFQRTVDQALGRRSGLSRDQEELVRLLQPCAYELHVNGTGTLKVRFTETMDGYTAGTFHQPTAQGAFLKAWQQ